METAEDFLNKKPQLENDIDDFVISTMKSYARQVAIQVRQECAKIHSENVSAEEEYNDGESEIMELNIEDFIK